jgi:hypothetical protein
MRDIAARLVESWHETDLDRVVADREDNGNCHGRRLGRLRCRITPGDDQGALTANEFGRQSRQSLVSTFRPAVFDRNVPSLNVTGFAQASAQRRYEVG